MSDPAKPLNPDLYAAISDDAPCGPGLDRSAFVELDGLCTEKPGQLNHMTGEESPPTPPEFRAARPVAMRLLEETRDLRPLSQLIQIEAHVNGALGLHAASHLLLHLVETQWQDLHPGPASDEAELNQRRRALDRIRNRRRVVNALEGTTVFRAKSVFGDVRVRDFLCATGKMMPPEGETAPDRAGISEMIAGADAGEAIANTRAALTATAAIFRKLAELFDGHFERPLKLDPIPEELDKLAAVFAEFDSDGRNASAGTDEDISDTDAPAGDAAAEQPARQAGPIKSDAEANALLDDLLAFYAASAPSSPIALILLRIRELRGASFIDWIDATGSNGPEKAAFELGQVDISTLHNLTNGADADAEVEPQEDLAGEMMELVNGLDEDIYKLSVTPVTDSSTGTGDSGGSDTEEASTEVDGTSAAELDLSALRAHADALRGLAFRVREALESGTTAPPALSATAGSITNRTSVKTALEQLAKFHENRDPSNPLQTILRRTKGLVDLNYLDTLAELSPGGGKPALPLIKPQPKGRG